jgi:hypothetical protein
MPAWGYLIGPPLIIWLIAVALALRRKFPYLTWPRQLAQILSSRLYEETGPEGQLLYHLEVRYVCIIRPAQSAYEQIYTHVYTRTTPFPAEWVAQLAPHRTITVRYNPRHPQEAILEP